MPTNGRAVFTLVSPHWYAFPLIVTHSVPLVGGTRADSNSHLAD